MLYRRKAENVIPPLLHLPEHRNRLFLFAGLCHSHHHQRSDDEDVTQRVDEETGALAHGSEDYPGHGRPYQPGAVEHHGVKGYGIANILLAVYHINYKRVACRHVK